jgi:hypothetical protein
MTRKGQSGGEFELGLEDWKAEGVPYQSVDDAYRTELKTTFESIKNYRLKFYYHDQWKPEYDRWVSMLAGMYAGPGKERVAWNQALTLAMIFTQPVLYEFERIRVKTLLLIGDADRTAHGANRAPLMSLRDWGTILNSRTAPSG